MLMRGPQGSALVGGSEMLIFLLMLMQCYALQVSGTLVQPSPRLVHHKTLTIIYMLWI